MPEGSDDLTTRDIVTMDIEREAEEMYQSTMTEIYGQGSMGTMLDSLGSFEAVVENTGLEPADVKSLDSITLDVRTDELPGAMSTEASVSLADATITTEAETYECRSCGVRRPVFVVVDDSFGAEERMECMGKCDDETTTHLRLHEDWEVQKYEFWCPECGYETLMWECEMLDRSGKLPECPECQPEGSGGGSELTELSGVDKTKAQRLIDAGYPTIEAINSVSQERLSSVPGIGNALAARIKANLDQESDSKLRLAQVVLAGDGDD